VELLHYGRSVVSQVDHVKLASGPWCRHGV
jgi:hypothetical protein